MTDLLFYDAFDDASAELDYPDVRDAGELVDVREFGYDDEPEEDGPFRLGRGTGVLPRA